MTEIIPVFADAQAAEEAYLQARETVRRQAYARDRDRQADCCRLAVTFAAAVQAAGYRNIAEYCTARRVARGE